ncbi:M56 family metallopeptidase [Guggenheimella bovis]
MDGIEFLTISSLERSIKSIFVIALILLIRRRLNLKSLKWANMILWSFLIIYLLVPYTILIEIKEPDQYGILKYLLEPILTIENDIRSFELEFGYFLSKANRFFVGFLFLIYFITQVMKRNRAFENAIPILHDIRIEEAIHSFGLRRTVSVFKSNSLKIPVTYGVLHPKIFLPAGVIDDNELLEHVLYHELVHIKKYHMVFNHLKNLITCTYWYNVFFLLASRYMEDDIEVLCDKDVIQRLGDTVQHRREYCMSMLKLIEPKENSRKVVLQLNPTMERMIIMKKWKTKFSGICAFAFILMLSMTTFADVRVAQTSVVIESEATEISEVNLDHRVNEITDEMYEKLILEEIPQSELASANIDHKVTLDGLSHKSYSFNMESWTEPNHDGFTIKTSEMSCNGGLNYALIIKENGKEIYNKHYTKATTLMVKAFYKSRFEVIVNNSSTNALTYRVNINSYIIRR